MKGVIVFILVFLSGSAVLGQDLYNKSVISIGPGSVLYVKEAIINEGTIINNGDMQVGGAWTNNAEYDAGEGKITFNSDLPQVINHNDQSFSKLTLTGGGEKLMLADITIENEITLEGGILVSQNDSKVVLGESAVVNGGSDASHINGPVYHRGAGRKVFPVGNGSLFLPVEFLNIEGTSPEVGVTLIETGGTILETSPGLRAVSAVRYWEVDATPGSLVNSKVILPVRVEGLAFGTNEYVVAQSDNVSEPFESLGQSAFQGNIAEGRVTSELPVTKSLLAVGVASSDDAVVVHNAISPGMIDERNDFMVIRNIENFPDNKLTVFNRWGDKVFEIHNYNNSDRVFRGKSNIGGEKDLSSGMYFYTLETKRDGKKINGFIVVKR